MTDDRAALLATDVERIPGVLRRIAAVSAQERAEREAAPGSAPGSAPGGVLLGAGRIVLTGLGSSRFAALQVAPIIRLAGRDVVVEHASAARPMPLGPGDLLVGISASGSTPETVAAVGRARAAGAAALAITDRAGSPLADAAAVAVDLGAGTEASGVSCVTYPATVASLLGVAAAFGAPIDVAGTLGAAADALDELLGTRAAWLHAAAAALDAAGPIHVIADAGSIGTAEQAALMFREGPRLDADATDAGDWLHVGIYTALPGYRAMLLGGTTYDAEIAATIARRRGTFVACGGAITGAAATVRYPQMAEHDPWVRSLVEPAVATLIAAELWARAQGSELV